MTEQSNVLEAAEIIQNELPGLVGAGAAARIHAKLAELLEMARTAPDAEARAQTEDEIYELLASHDRTREELDRLLPVVDEERGSFEPLAGEGDPVAVDKYVCPHGDYAWPVLSVDDPLSPPTECPVHRLPLVFCPIGGNG